LDSDGALEERDRQHEAMVPPEFQQDSVQPTKGAMLDSHPLANSNEGPRLGWEARLDRGLYRFHFGFLNGDGSLAYPDDEENPRSHQNGEPVQWVEPAKDIPREEWLLGFYEPVRPSAPTLIERQKPFKALTAQVGCNDILVPTPDL
jgi:hypothetical protein